MKIENKLIIFKCDMCSKKTTVIDDRLTYPIFPYNKGWRYLYMFNFKGHGAKIHEVRDKHFCHSECLKMFLQNEIIKAEPSGSKVQKRGKK